jgi:NAD-dependent deacetylase
VKERLAQVARLISQADSTVALTGAGISIDSGIPAFRGSQGLWERFDPMEYASIEAFRRDPAKVWTMLKELNALVVGAQPNPAHQALARLEELGRLSAVITQNIDGLHQAAGNRTVIEFHGSGRHLCCLDCGRRWRREEFSLEEIPPRCDCGGLIKPDVVFFGEPIPERALLAAFGLAGSCQVMLVVGTSAVVAPASHLPVMAKRAGAVVVEINPEPTPLSGEIADYSFASSGSELLPALVAEVERLLERA